MSLTSKLVLSPLLVAQALTTGAPVQWRLVARHRPPHRHGAGVRWYDRSGTRQRFWLNEILP